MTKYRLVQSFVLFVYIVSIRKKSIETFCIYIFLFYSNLQIY